MATSVHDDRGRRRAKPKAKAKWAKFLLRPQTVTFLVTVGRGIAVAVWFIHWITRLRD